MSEKLTQPRVGENPQDWKVVKDNNSDIVVAWQDGEEVPQELVNTSIVLTDEAQARKDAQDAEERARREAREARLPFKGLRRKHREKQVYNLVSKLLS